MRIVVATLAAFVAGAAVAAEPAPPPADGPAAAQDNFAIAPAEGRHLKIDRRDGRISLCEEKAGAWRCSLVPDDRDAYEGEIAALKKRVADLEAEVAALRAERRAPADAADEEKRLDEFLDFSDKAFRRFFGMVREMRREFGDESRI